MFSISVSQLFGFASIACWLGAQFPQVLENWRRQSCEGLALPFLANWFLGDLSNLIGCILTHQLPFQKWLATYFVLVDLTLVIQYFYYDPLMKSIPSFTVPSFAKSVSQTRRISNEREAARYRALSAVAANVAATAALAAQHDEVAHWTRWSRNTVDQTHQVGHESRIEEPQDGEVAFPQSRFHYERGEDPRRKRVCWSVERHRPRSGSVGQVAGISPLASQQHMLSADFFLDSTGRSRTLSSESRENLETRSARIKHQSSAASRRRPSMVFLSVWVIFGIGAFTVSRQPAEVGLQQREGTLLGVKNYAAPDLMTSLHATFPVVSHTDLSMVEDTFPQTEPDYSNKRRIIGRIFAWLCTTLYLTSRLPQIWKNFVRKSVEGLSMYLFIFAFLGNVFYVASILLSPKMSSPQRDSLFFLKESVPYLLGSAGTLLFDITIVAQSYVYRPHLQRHPQLGGYEEGRALLTTDSTLLPIEDRAFPRGRDCGVKHSIS